MGLYEDISDGMKQCKVVVACVSDEVRIQFCGTLYTIFFKIIEALFCIYKYVSVNWLLVGPWASYQVCEIAGCTCTVNAGNIFPPPTSKETAS